MDDAGAVLGRSEPLLPRDFLDCRCIAERLRTRAPSDCRLLEPDRQVGGSFTATLDVRPLAEATVCAVALLQVVEDDDRVLSPLLWQVVEKPSIWSVVSNLGAQRRAAAALPRRHRSASPRCPSSPHTDTWRMPLSLYVNDEAALHVDLFVADSGRPASPRRRPARRHRPPPPRPQR